MDSILDSLKGNPGTATTAEYKNQLDEKDYTLGSDKVKVSVIGVGGGGNNTVTRLNQMGIKSAETVAINTDMTHLKVTEATRRMLIGKNLTRGLGAGGFPEVAQKCAEHDRDELQKAIGTSELVFLTAGMGGGTGTGASPVVADIAKKQGAVVVGMVTYPFSLERARTKNAQWGIDQLSKTCDTVVVIDNNRLVQYAPNLPIKEAFKLADDIVAKAVKGISDTIMYPSLMNIDFADVRASMTNGGVAMISMGEGKGSNKVQQAVESTLSHPLLDVEYEGAKGALIHIAGGTELSLGDATRIGEGLTDQFDKNANVYFGARIHPELGDRVVVTSIMTGVKSEMLHGNSEQEKAAELAKQSTMELEEVTW